MLSRRTFLVAVVFALVGCAVPAAGPKILILGLDRNLEDNGDNAHSSAPVLSSLLASQGYTDVTLVRVAMTNHSTLASFNYAPYDVVFVCNANNTFTPYSHVFNAAEGQRLANYLGAGGRAYMEGGDVWFQDPYANSAFDFRSVFHLSSTTQSLKMPYVVKGVGGTFLAGLEFSYDLDHSGFWDVLAGSGTGSVTAMQNYSDDTRPVVEGAWVGYDGPTYKTVASSLRFSGILDGSGNNTRAWLLQKVMGFLLPADLTCDLNQDGVVNAQDLALMKSYLAGSTAVLPCGRTCADVNADGKQNALDLLAVMRATLSKAEDGGLADPF